MHTCTCVFRNFMQIQCSVYKHNFEGHFGKVLTKCIVIIKSRYLGCLSEFKIMFCIGGSNTFCLYFWHVSRWILTGPNTFWYEYLYYWQKDTVDETRHLLNSYNSEYRYRWPITFTHTCIYHIYFDVVLPCCYLPIHFISKMFFPKCFFFYLWLHKILFVGQICLQDNWTPCWCATNK